MNAILRKKAGGVKPTNESTIIEEQPIIDVPRALPGDSPESSFPRVTRNYILMSLPLILSHPAARRRFVPTKPHSRRSSRCMSTSSARGVRAPAAGWHREG